MGVNTRFRPYAHTRDEWGKGGSSTFQPKDVKLYLVAHLDAFESLTDFRRHIGFILLSGVRAFKEEFAVVILDDDSRAVHGVTRHFNGALAIMESDYRVRAIAMRLREGDAVTRARGNADS